MSFDTRNVKNPGSVILQQTVSPVGISTDGVRILIDYAVSFPPSSLDELS